MENTSVVNVKVNTLKGRGYNNFQDWYSKSNTIYIGREIENYVLGKVNSKWQNPFTMLNVSEETSLKLYETYVRNELMDQLKELEGKELGCWCKPNVCHGDVLVKLINELK